MMYQGRLDCFLRSVYDHPSLAEAYKLAAQDDEMFGQLGDDIIQGDGAVSLTAFKNEAAFDPYSPAQDADPSFDLRNITQRVDLMAGNDTGWTLRFDVFEDLGDGDDYIEGNGGEDVVFGGLGQDDIVGGSSSLFSLLMPAQRPDGAACSEGAQCQSGICEGQGCEPGEGRCASIGSRRTHAAASRTSAERPASA